MAEVNEERSEAVYEVTVSMPEKDFPGFPTEREIQMAIYRGIDDVDSADAVEVVRR